MAKVIFTISYEIRPEKREEYLSLMRQMKNYLKNIKGRDYSFYELKGKKNNFSEIFQFSSLDEYNNLEDHDDQMTDFVSKLEQLILNGKMKYTTLIELE